MPDYGYQIGLLGVNARTTLMNTMIGANSTKTA